MPRTPSTLDRIQKHLPRIKALVKEGRSVCSIAEELKMGRNPLYSYLREHSINWKSPIYLTHDVRRKLSELSKKEHLSALDLSEAVKIPPSAVRRWAKENRVKLRSAKFAVNRDLEKKILEMNSNGMLVYEISQKAGVSYNALVSWEKERGFKLNRKNYEAEIIARAEKELEGTGLSLIKYNSAESIYGCTKGHHFKRTLSNIWKNPTCPKCSPKSKPENEIKKWLKEKKFEIRSNYKCLEFGKRKKEIDLFLPEFRVGIEHHGCYWHSENFVPSRFHRDKAHAAMEQGIKLFQFFDFEWATRPEAIKGIIEANTKFVGSVLFARKLDVRSVSGAQSKAFLKQFHVQGFTGGPFRFGLWQEDLLISLLTLRRHREGLEIARFCTRPGYRVPGGFSRLLKAACGRAKEERVSKLITFSDLRYSTGNVYRKSGFTLIHETAPDWFWFRRGVVRNRRFSFKRSDDDVRKEGWMKVYGAGHLKFELTIPE